MSEHFSRRTLFRSAAIGTILIGYPTAFWLWRRKQSSSVGLLGLNRFNVVDVPIPEGVSGPFRLQACLSSDERTLLVAGGPPISPNLFATIFEDVSEGTEKAFFASLGQTISVADWPPGGARDYRALVTFPGPAFVLAMAISPNGQMAALLVRIASENSRFPASMAERIDKEKPFHDVLYTVSIGSGDINSVAVLDGRYSPNEVTHSCFESKSICWNENSRVIYFYDRKGIYRSTLDGRQTRLYTFCDCSVYGSLVHRNGVLRFIQAPWTWTPNPDLQLVRHTGTPKIVALHDDGTLAVETALPLTIFGRPSCISTAVLSDTYFATVNAHGMTYSQIELDVAPNASPNEGQRGIIYQDQPYFVAPCYVFSGGQEILLAKFTHLDARRGGSKKLKDLGGADFCKLIRVPLT